VLKTGIVVWLAALAAACSSKPKSSGCSTDTDCKGDRICVSGDCVAPGAGGATYGSHNAADWCQRYADLCPAENFDVSACIARCSQSMTSDDCWFPACGVEVGKCDGQEPGDGSILACGERHGWKQPGGGTGGATGGTGGASTGGTGGASCSANATRCAGDSTVEVCTNGSWRASACENVCNPGEYSVGCVFDAREGRSGCLCAPDGPCGSEQRQCMNDAVFLWCNAAPGSSGTFELFKCSNTACEFGGSATCVQGATPESTGCECSQDCDRCLASCSGEALCCTGCGCFCERACGGFC